jgi:hypothetical protein
VQRPFASSDLTFAADSTAPNGGTVATTTGFFVLQTDGVLDFGQRAAGAPPSDYRVTRLLADLRRLHLATPLGSARIAGRPCRTYRFGSPLGDPLVPIGPDEHADLCIDASGLVLSERWERQGQVLREATATSVEDTGVPPVAPPEGARRPSPLQYGQVEGLARDNRPAVDLPYSDSSRPPSGFPLVLRERLASTGQTAAGPQVSDLAYVDTYVRGTDAIQVTHREQGAETAPGIEGVQAGRLGRGRVTVSLTGTSIVFAPPHWSLTVSGPLDVARLTAFAATLRPGS